MVYLIASDSIRGYYFWMFIIVVEYFHCTSFYTAMHAYFRFMTLRGMRSIRNLRIFFKKYSRTRRACESRMCMKKTQFLFHFF